MDAELEHAGMSAPDRHLAHELALGCVRWRGTLDWLIARKTGNRPQKPAIQNLLRLGVYQMFWLDRVPDHAAVNETVELARRTGLGAKTGFVNALLRGYGRERAETRLLLDDLKTKHPALGWSHPTWLVERWTALWGRERTARLLAWNNTPAVTFARVNTLRTDLDSLLEQWRTEHVEFDVRHWDWTEKDSIFELKSHPPITSLTSFSQGRFYVQDPSTLLAVHVLDPQPGETILDMCAAPGGKTTYIAQRVANQCRLVAHDASYDRLSRLASNCERLGVTCVERVSSSPRSLFSRVLADVPCSNTGVLRRRADARWRVSMESLQSLRTAQQDLLRRAGDFLAKGGVLVYSTCSLEPEENRGVIDSFLAQNPGFELVAERQLLPFVDDVDGAYVAKLVRQA